MAGRAVCGLNAAGGLALWRWLARRVRGNKADRQPPLTQRGQQPGRPPVYADAALVNDGSYASATAVVGMR